MGAPGAFMFLLQLLNLQFIVVCAGWMGDIDKLAAAILTCSLTELLIMIPTGIDLAAC